MFTFPSSCLESYSTAQDVLNATQARLAPRVQQILTGVAANTSESGTGRNREGEDGDMEGKGEEGLEEPGKCAVEVNPALRGVSQKLLEKVHVLTYVYIYIYVRIHVVEWVCSLCICAYR